jgi:hypothetical protein
MFIFAVLLRGDRLDSLVIGGELGCLLNFHVLVELGDLA